jgi:hypothetical protein
MKNYTYNPVSKEIMPGPTCRCVALLIDLLLNFHRGSDAENIREFVAFSDSGYDACTFNAACMHNEVRRVLIEVSIRFIVGSELKDNDKIRLLSMYSNFKTDIIIAAPNSEMHPRNTMVFNALPASMRKRLSASLLLKSAGQLCDVIPDMMLREILAPCSHSDYLAKLVSIFPELVERNILSSVQLEMIDDIGPKAAHKLA